MPATCCRLLLDDPDLDFRLHVGVQAQRIALDSTRRSAFSDEPGAGPGAFNRGPLEPFDATVLLRWDLARLFESERASAHRAARRRTEDVERQTMAALASWSAAEARLGDTAALTPLARAQTEVAAYGVRARPGAPVAAPLEWDEVRHASLSADRWTVANVFRRLARRADPWAAMEGSARPLPAGVLSAGRG